MPFVAQEAALQSAWKSNPAPTNSDTTNSFPADPLSPASWHYGNWRGYLALSTQLRYDDNILETDKNSVADFIGSASPSFNLEYAPAGENGIAITHLDYSPQFVAYLDHEQYNSIDQTANLKLERSYGRSRFEFNHHYSLSTDPQMEQIGWAQLQTHHSDLEVGYELTEKTTLSLIPRQEWSSVENGITVWEYGATLEATYHKSEKIDLLASYYAGEIQTTPGVKAFTQNARLGISWDADSRNRLDLRVGYQIMTYSGGLAASGNQAPDLLLDWNYQLTAKTIARLNVSYQTYFSQYLAYQVDKTISSRLTLSHNLTEKITFDVLGGNSLVEQDSVLKSQTNGGEFNYWDIGAGVSYRINRSTDVRMDFDHQERSGNNLSNSFQRNLAELSVQHRF